MTPLAPDAPLRATVRDGDQTISFLVAPHIVRCLVAGCSINPATIGDLLVAAEVYLPGLARRVMTELMAFDNAIRRHGAEHARDLLRAAEQDSQGPGITFQVVEEASRREALEAGRRPLVVFDLTRKVIHASPGVELTAAGEVHVYEGERRTGQTVAYFLPAEWTIEAL